MPKYAAEMADILSNLELDQVSLYIKDLTIDDIKIINSQVLTKINDLKHRNEISHLFIERKQQIESVKKSLGSVPTPQAQSLSDRLYFLYDNFTTSILRELADDEAKKLFLASASEDELFVIKQKLRNKSEQEKQFYAAIELEINRRNEGKPKWKIEYQEDWRKKQNVQWQAGVWNNIIKDIKQVNVEIKNRSTIQPVEEPKELKKPWYSRLWAAIKNIFSFSSKSKKSAKYKDNEESSFKAELSQEEQEKVDILRKAGAKHIAEVTGVVKVGESKERSQKNIMSAMMARFGMVISSQMVSGTQNENHSDLLTVLTSLTDAEDTDATIETLDETFKSILPGIQDGALLKGEHAFAIGGFPELVTAFESEVFKKLDQSPELFSEDGLTLSEQEKAQIAMYKANMDRSRDLSNVLSTVSFSWGGYEEDKEKHGYKKGENFAQKQKQFEDQLKLASKKLQESCANLKDGEALYLETGLEGHAMQLVIKRIGNEFKLSTYDSSGALENTSLGSSLFGLLKLSRLDDGAKRKNAYTFSVPQDRLISKEGQDYLSYLIRTNSMAGWAQTHIEQKIKHSTMEERSHMGFFGRLRALRQQSYIYSNYMKHFGSLASPGSPPQFEALLQRPQNTQNCFAKKALACELYELGKPTYKKVRLAMLLDQKKGLLTDIKEGKFVSMEYIPMLEDIKPEYLSPSELHEISTRLCEVKEPPTKKYYERYFQALLDAREKLAQVDNKNNKLAIKRIDAKIGSHAKNYYLYLKKNNHQNEIDEVFSPKVKNDSFDWTSGEMPLKTGDDRKIVPEALGRLSEYSSAQTWKATFQLLNHQIKKLGINERHIISSNERLSHASYRQARQVTLADLENANIVTFTTGASRKEEIKIEISIKGVRKEIDHETFFKLALQNKESLTNPKVMGLLDYLRNSSHNIENKYSKEIYPTQRKVFDNKLEEHVNKARQLLIRTVENVSGNLEKLNLMLVQSKRNIEILKQEINTEKINSNDKSTLKLKNLELRLSLLQKEKEELNRLHHSAVTAKTALLDADFIGSPINKIKKAQDLITRLKENHKDLQTINAVNNAFTSEQFELKALEKKLESVTSVLEVDSVQMESYDRIDAINHYRQKIVSNYLQINHEYRVLDELSAGKMGTEKDRNRDMYRQSESERTEFYKQGKIRFCLAPFFMKFKD